ncbi:alanine racemase [Oceanobacillus chungangensis]|uniref:Alanine racemase n=1 Tax=Oceanobacillus chungangensis TaxID=1229152 RepID=A0A3D8PLS6_9BACI|nr:alanine racemase [Oceanobacillus chungangensis]RDW16612.1 alanine racemase [Oceanobacillus chungangensis]
MEAGSYRDTWVEVSLDKIQHNVTTFKNYIHNNVKLMAVVKADGYGHGAVEVAQAAMEAGADYLAVAFLDEAIQLRQAGIKSPILVLGYTKSSAVEEAIKNNITLTVFTPEAIEKIIAVAEDMKQVVPVHVKIDSGMNRIGINNKEDAHALVESINSEYVRLEGVFTHFADADSLDPTYTEQQFSRFNEIVTHLEQHGFEIPIKHCCNSAATIAFPKMHLDMVRVGISLYGLYPSEHLREKISLKQAMSFKTKAIFIKNVAADQPISYGLTFAPREESTIATMPIGYADGLSRSLSSKGAVTIRGERAPIVGRVCMDQTMIDVTAFDQINQEDIITIFGEPSEGYISLAEVADQMNTIHYETACLIGKRVPRVYVNDGKIIKERGLLKR